MSIDLVIENNFTLNKTRNRLYLVESVSDTKDADDFTVLAPVQLKFLLYCLK